MQPISVAKLRAAISKLPADRPQVNPRKWYLTQKEHWLGWLAEYGGPGAYGRKGGKGRDAQFAYNHVVQVEMLLWLARAAGISPALVRRAQRASASAATLMQKSGAVRALVPWDDVANALFGRAAGSTPTGRSHLLTSNVA